MRVKVSINQREDGSISIALPVRSGQASIEHGILMLSLNETEAQQLEDALHKRKSKQELRRI